MYAAVPGKTGVSVVRSDFSSTEATAKKPPKSVARLAALLEQKRVEAAQPAQQPVEPKVVVPHYCEGYACSCKGFHDEFSRKDPYQFNMRSGKEHRKCAHSHFGRRGRRAVVIFR